MACPKPENVFYAQRVFIHLGDGWQVLASSLAWLAVSVVVGWWATHWTPEQLARTGPFTTLRQWEHGGAYWQRRYRIRHWKDRLPEAGGLFPKGRSMRHLEARTLEGLHRFRCETVRAERVHWLIVASGFLHLIWCRQIVFVLMFSFGLWFNAPFIVIQRYNRGRLDKLITSRARRARPPARER